MSPYIRSEEIKKDVRTNIFGVNLYDLRHDLVMIELKCFYDIDYLWNIMQSNRVGPYLVDVQLESDRREMFCETLHQ